ncbi:MAG: NH(3)-dependent synthetase, partial [Verrucomicrobiales bacterium]|nr:NH(3)-dependent synthetase [Verrucomicrobiales bacterium]
TAPCTQEEFFFRMPFHTMDLLWFAYENNVSSHEVAEQTGLKELQVQHAFADFAQKFRATEYLRLSPQPIE